MQVLFGLLLLLTISLNVLVVADDSKVPYQVSIWLNPGQESIGAKHLCNGAIVHERVIITTADSLRFRMPGSVISHPVIPSMISVVAGDYTFNYAKIIRNVIDIKIAVGFNSTTLDNDIALIVLDVSFPLAIRSDIKWIILDDHDHVNHSCIANFNNSSSYVYTTGPTQPIFIMDNKICSNSTNITTPRRRDICSFYILNPGAMCNITEDNLKTINDRGTPLVCDNKLFGLLSMVIPPGATNYNANCNQQRKLHAYYSRVAPHLGWIYQQIATESRKDSLQANHTMAPPFVAKPSSSSGSIQTPSQNIKKTSGAALSTRISQCLEIFLFITLFYVNICHFIRFVAIH